MSPSRIAIGLVVCACAVAAVAKAGEPPEKLVDWINEQGGAVEYQANDPTKPVVRVRLPELDDKSLQRIVASLPQLQALDVGFSRATPAGLAKLKGLKGLQSLAIANTTLTDASA